MPVYNVGYVKGMRYCEQPTVLLARTYLNLNSISNIFQETHGFLVLKDPVIICIYLRKSQLLWHQKQTFLWLGERPSSHLKVTKMYLVQKLNIFLKHSLRIFGARKESPVQFKKIPNPLFYQYCHTLSHLMIIWYWYLLQ